MSSLVSVKFPVMTPTGSVVVPISVHPENLSPIVSAILLSASYLRRKPDARQIENAVTWAQGIAARLDADYEAGGSRAAIRRDQLNSYEIRADNQPGKRPPLGEILDLMARGLGRTPRLTAADEVDELGHPGSGRRRERPNHREAMGDLWRVTAASVYAVLGHTAASLPDWWRDAVRESDWESIHAHHHDSTLRALYEAATELEGYPTLDRPAPRSGSAADELRNLRRRSAADDLDDI